MHEKRFLATIFLGVILYISVWHLSILQVYQSTAPVEATPLPSEALLTFFAESGQNSTPAPLDPLPVDDFRRLIDLKNFSYKIQQSSCLPGVRLLILVHSAPANFRKRLTIRDTWGHDASHTRLLFLLGTVNSTDLQARLEEENSRFSDLVQGNFRDAYRNMTYKHVMALKWLVYNCPSVNHLLKTDDDVFVNTPALDALLGSAGLPSHGLLLCHRINDARVKRTWRSKWRVSGSEYHGHHYPPYCPGFSVLYSADVVARLYRGAQRMAYFWIDDVHVTGIVAQHQNVSITPMGPLLLREKALEPLLSGRVHPSRMLFVFVQPDLIESEIRLIWRRISERNQTTTAADS